MYEWYIQRLKAMEHVSLQRLPILELLAQRTQLPISICNIMLVSAAVPFI